MERVSNMSEDLAVKVGVTHELAKSAHARLNEHEAEIKSLRASRHEHSNTLQRHEGIFSTINSINAKIESLIAMKNMAVGGFIVGNFFIGFLSGKLMGWW